MLSKCICVSDLQTGRSIFTQKGKYLVVRGGVVEPRLEQQSISRWSRRGYTNIPQQRGVCVVTQKYKNTKVQKHKDFAPAQVYGLEQIT